MSSSVRMLQLAHRALIAVVLLCSFVGLSLARPHDPTTTPALRDPRLQVRADGATVTGINTIGWTSTFGSFTPFHCPSNSVWSSVGPYGRCCPDKATEDCHMMTTCINGTVMANDHYTTICNGSSAETSCISGTIFNTIGDTSPVSNFQCWPSWNGGNWAATRSIPASITATVPIVNPQTAAPTSTAAASPSETGKSGGGGTPAPTKNKGWIAGPVVGSIAGLALIIAVVLLLLRRKKRKDAEEGRKGSGHGYTYGPTHENHHQPSAYSEESKTKQVRPKPHWAEYQEHVPMDDVGSTGKNGSVNRMSGGKNLSLQSGGSTTLGGGNGNGNGNVRGGGQGGGGGYGGHGDTGQVSPLSTM